jgi:putative NADPH-quinone reductase
MFYFIYGTSSAVISGKYASIVMTAGNPEQKYVTPNNKGEPLF